MAMSTTLLTLQPCTFQLKWKNQFSFPSYRIHVPHTFTSPIAMSITKPLNKTITKYHLDCKTPSSLSSDSKTPLESLANTIWEALRKPAAAAILIGFLLMCVSNNALAASGGVMGGSSFSSSSDSSSSYSSSDSDSSFSSSSYSRSRDGSSVDRNQFLFIIFLFVSAISLIYLSKEKTTVLKYQVGLSGMDRSLQTDLNRIAEVADTSSPKGFSYVLSETILALLQHTDYCISGYSSVGIKRGIEDGEKHFNKLSIEERGKFDEETLVNVNNKKRKSTRSLRSDGISNEYLVLLITILVAAKGELKIPSINGRGNLKEALQKLGSIPSSELLAVQVLWTPQSENDTLSEQELREDYPLLRPL